jgi:hypothetical protein
MSSRGLSIRTALLAGAVTATLAAPASPAVAAPDAAPSVHVAFAHTWVTAHASLAFTVSSAHLPSGTTLSLQRYFSRTHRFQDVKSLNAHNGSFTTAGLGLGHYEFQVVARRHKRVVATSNVDNIYSFGVITATQLCKSSKSAKFAGTCTDNTIQVGTEVYEYEVIGGQGNRKPNGDPDVQAIRSTCRSVSLTYAVSNTEQSHDRVTKFGSSLTQAGVAEQSASAAPGAIASTRFRIRSKDWDLEFWSNTGDDVFWTGRFSCWTKNGFH